MRTRRHHNNTGARQIARGKTVEQVGRIARMALRLGIMWPKRAKYKKGDRVEWQQEIWKVYNAKLGGLDRVAYLLTRGARLSGYIPEFALNLETKSPNLIHHAATNQKQPNTVLRRVVPKCLRGKAVRPATAARASR